MILMCEKGWCAGNLALCWLQCGTLCLQLCRPLCAPLGRVNTFESLSFDLRHMDWPGETGLFR